MALSLCRAVRIYVEQQQIVRHSLSAHLPGWRGEGFQSLVGGAGVQPGRSGGDGAVMAVTLPSACLSVRGDGPAVGRCG